MKYILTALGISTQMSLLTSTVVAQQPRMNVLFIAVDDLKPDLGCYGNKLVKTPNIDRLAKNGTVFLSNYCQQAVSGPTRASLMTGRRPDYTMIYDMSVKMRDKVPNTLTLPQYLISKGYTTAGIGKIYDSRCVDSYLDQPSWSIPYFKNLDNFFYSQTGNPETDYQLPATKVLAAKYKKEAEAKGLKDEKLRDYVKKFLRPSVECVDVPDDAYADGANALHAKKILTDLAKDDKPFFFAVGFSKPHLPFVAPKKYWDLYKRDEMPIAKFQKHAEKSPELAYHNSGELRQYTDIPPLCSFTDQPRSINLPIDKQKELIHGYYACVSYTDAQIGILLNTLDSLGLSKNTIIILWGDHGWHLGDHDLWCKHTNFENATHAPLIMSVPGLKANKTGSLTEFVDVFPTVCDLLDVKIPDNLDGVSLVPIIKDPRKEIKKFAVSQYPRVENLANLDKTKFKNGKIMGYSIRTEKYRYTIWVGNDFHSTKPLLESDIISRELYDYKNDPLETINIVDASSQVKIVKELNCMMVDFLKSQVK